MRWLHFPPLQLPIVRLTCSLLASIYRAFSRRKSLRSFIMQIGTVPNSILGFLIVAQRNLVDRLELSYA